MVAPPIVVCVSADSCLLCELTVRLPEHGLLALTTSSSVAALRLFQEHTTLVCALLIDLEGAAPCAAHLPAVASESCPAVPFCFLAGPHRLGEARSWPEGAPVFRKPIPPDTLAATILSLVSREEPSDPPGEK